MGPLKLGFAIALISAAAFATQVASPPKAAGQVKSGSRKAQIQRCAACHQREYENWRQGPHAHSLEKLLEIKEKALDASTHIPESLRESIRSNLARGTFEGTCFRCHAPTGNVYEDSISDSWDGVSPVVAEPLDVAAYNKELSHGVDCITCHVLDNRVVTRADYKPPKNFVPPEGFCNPKPSKIFSHLNNCVTCHRNLVESYVKRFDANREHPKRPYASCNDCHMAHDQNGKVSHFYYWASGEKERGYVLNGYLGEIKATVLSANGKGQLTLRWATEFSPHPIGWLLYAFLVEILDEKQTVAFSEKIGFIDFGTVAEKAVSTKYLLKYLTEVVPLEPMSELTRTISLPPEIPRSGTVRVTVYRKKPFYGPASAEVKLFQKDEPYHL